MNILLIEKEEAIIQILEAFFMKEKWNYDIATDGVIGTQMYSLNKNKYNLVLVDVELPSLDGVEVVKYIRNISLETLILVLAEKKFEEELISSLQQGADGYLARPFSPLLMVARIKALYRRINLERGKRVNLNIEQVICTKYLKIYPEKHKVIFNKQEINSLSPKEFAILTILASSPTQVFSRKKLLELVWGNEYFGDARTIDTHVKTLRQKLEKVGPHVIITVWGVGYKYDELNFDILL